MYARDYEAWRQHRAELLREVQRERLVLRLRERQPG
jgi:hypothetical protein